jgi:hypothetical protein
MKRPTDGGQWTEVHAFWTGYLYFPPTVIANVQGRYQRRARQQIFLE